MSKKDTPGSFRAVMTTTHVDKHGDQMTLAALRSGAKQLNSGRKAKVTINHDQTLPPSGVVTGAVVEKRADGFHQLVATQRFYDKQKLVRMPDGTIGILEYFDDIKFTFAEIETGDFDGYELGIDVHSFESQQSADYFIEKIRQESPLEFEVGHFYRKSFLNDPELIFKLGSKVVHALLDAPYTATAGVVAGALVKKALDKMADKVGDDFAGVYAWMRNSMIEGAKQMLPKNRKITYILRIPGPINLELIIRTKDVNDAVKAITNEKITKCREVIDGMTQIFTPAKLSLLYNVESQAWEFNFMISKDGKTLSSPRAIVARKKAYTDLEKFMDAKKTATLLLQDNATLIEEAGD